jgi:hypothetical protein
MIKITASRPHATLRQDDPDFTFSPDGIRVVPRAGFEVSSHCPAQYKQVIVECLNNGWLKPVAHMRDTEYTMELLRK